MLEDKLRMSIASQKDRVVIEPGDNALEFDTVNQEYGDGSFVLSNIVQKNFLNILAFIAH